MNRNPVLQAMAVLAVTTMLAGCSGSSPGDQVFDHDIATAVRPWTHQRFDAAEDKFTFAVFSDLTGGERERVFEIAVAQLSLLRPELIINVGDLIEGASTNLDELANEWDFFDERFALPRPGASSFRIVASRRITSRSSRWTDRALISRTS